MKYALLLLLLTGPAFGAESVTLTQIVTQAPAASTLSVSSIAFNWTAQRIVVILTDGTNNFTFTYSGATATALMVALNKANLSTTSLQKRVMQQLITDGYISGTISGTPD